MICPGCKAPPRGLRAFLDAANVCGNLLDRGCPPQLLPDLLCDYELNRLEQDEQGLVRMAMAREYLFRRITVEAVRAR